MKSPMFENEPNQTVFMVVRIFMLCFYTLCLHVFIYKEHIKTSNLAVFYLGSTMKTYQVVLNAVSLVVSL